MARPLSITAVGTAQVDTANKKSGTGSLLLEYPTTSYLVVDNSGGELNISGSWTVECWVYPEDPINSVDPGEADYQIFDIAVNPYQDRFRLALQIREDPDNRIQASGGDGSITSFTPNKADIVDDWRHLALVSDGSNLKLYLDGVEIGSDTLTDNNLALIDNNGDPADLRIGRAWPLSTSNFYGWIDEVHITNKAKYTSTFTPDARISPDESTVLLIHMDGADGSTTFEDDIGEQGAATLTAFGGIEAELTVAPIVLLNDDSGTWDDTNTWDMMWDYPFDLWIPGQTLPPAEFDLVATGGLLQIASATLDTELQIPPVDADNFNIASAELDTEFAITIDADNFNIAESTVNAEFGLQVDTNVDIDSLPVQLDTETDVIVTGRILKLASLFIENFGGLTVEAEVEVDGQARLDSEFNSEAFAGRIVNVDDPYVYTWDTVEEDRWDNFVLDRWEPRGFIAFSRVTLEGTATKIVTASSELQVEFNQLATPTRITQGASTQEGVFDVESSADITRTAQSELLTQTQLSALAEITRNAQALLETAYEIAPSANIIRTSGAVLDGALNFEINADNFNIASATLDTEFGIVINGSLIPSVIVDPLESEFALEVQADRIVGGSATLDAFAAQISDAGLIVRATLEFANTVELTADADMTFGASAELATFGDIVIEAESRGPVLGTAELANEFAVTFEGDLRLLISAFSTKVLSETRIIIPAGETRIQPVLQENRQITVETETRTQPVLPESRLLDAVE